MIMLLAASATFLGIHLLVSGTRLRDVIVAAIGENPYLGLFSLSSLGAIVWLCISYNHAYASVDNRVLYDLGQGFRNFAIPVVTAAFMLAAPGVLMSNPTSARQETAGVRGVLRITRHPFLWGTAIWAGYHMLAAIMLASVIFFGTFLVLALLGTRAIDAKCRRRRGAEWQAIAYQTSTFPSPRSLRDAIASSRANISIGALWWRSLKSQCFCSSIITCSAYRHFPMPGCRFEAVFPLTGA